MLFSIITPTYQQLDWLRLCIASVADQGKDAQGDLANPQENSQLSIEHIIQDAGTLGIEDFAREVGADFYQEGKLIFTNSSTLKETDTSSSLPPYSLKIFSEKDTGMYDAINRGFQKCKGEIISHLNSDEQYLQGALQVVQDYAKRYPEAEIFIGNVVIIGAEGEYICSRRVLEPLYFHTAVCQLNTFTAATFIRRSAFSDNELFFDHRLQCNADSKWMLQAIKAKKRFQVLPYFISAFMEDGANLSLSEKAKKEGVAKRNEHPIAKKFQWFFTVQHRLRRLLAGYYRETPFSYAIFTKESLKTRVAQYIQHPKVLWRSRL